MKRLIRACFAVPAAIEIWRYRLFRAFAGDERAFRGLTERLANRTGYVGLYLRAAVYSRILARCSQEVQIGYGTVFSKPDAVIGSHVYIGRYCTLGWVEIDRDVMVADFVAIPSGGHTHGVDGAGPTPPRTLSNDFRLVRVGEGTWIGSQAVILADVGRYCVIGAGAVVTKPIPEGSIAVGVPAQVVGSTINRDAAATKTSELRRRRLPATEAG